MTILRHALAQELRSKVDKYGIVVWDDPNREYATVAAELAPPDATFEQWDGSFYSLRRRIEPLLADAHPPRLVIYLPCAVPDRDPLAEARDAGTVFVRRLDTLIERAANGQLTSKRIREIAAQARNIEQAEAALEGSDQGADARLVAVLGASSPSDMVRKLLTRHFDEGLDAEDLWSAARSFLEDAVGVSLSDSSGEELRRDVFRQITLNILTATGADLSDSLPAATTPTERQLRVAREAVVLLRSGGEVNEYKRLVRLVDKDLHLEAHLEWDPALTDCDITAAVDAVAHEAAIDMLLEGDHSTAGSLARKRLESSWWARSGASGETRIESGWRVIRAIADLEEAVRAAPAGTSFSGLLSWYADEGWRVDAAHRQVESLRAVMAIDSESLDKAFQAARSAYDAWLECLLDSVSSMASDADPGNATLSQRHIHRKVAEAEGPTVYIWVDALRYELGQALTERLQQLPATINVDPAIATPPTLTPVGMAALLPDAALHMQLVLVGNKVRVLFGSDEVKTVTDRVARLEQAHGRVANLRLTDAVQRGNDWLRNHLETSDLVLIRSQEIDHRGESDLLACTWGDFENVLTVLTTLVARLLHVGARTVVIAADHGFLALSRELGPDRVVDPPTGAGELHRRVWIGQGGTATDATVKVPLSSFGVRSDLDLIIPKGLGVFRAGGGLQFFHGGISPQEVIVPVITVTASDITPEPARTIGARVAGDRITTGVVVASLEADGEPDLFGSMSKVRVQLTEGREPCSRIIGGEGVDIAAGTVEVAPGQPRTVTLQITRNLSAGTELDLDVIDASTGTRLSRQPVEVPVDVTVEDDLG